MSIHPMRFGTAADSFGIMLEHVHGRFCRLELNFGEFAIGDGSYAVVWADLQSLGRLNVVRDQRLDPDRARPRELLLTILADDGVGGLYDQCLVSLGELFDRWVIRAYRWRDEAVWVICAGLDVTTDPVRLFRASFDDYSAIVNRAKSYYETLPV